jgi:hypothetical protein
VADKSLKTLHVSNGGSGIRPRPISNTYTYRRLVVHLEDREERAGSDFREVIGCAIAQAVVRCFSPRRPRFAPRAVHVGFVVGKVALGHVL